jgi:hypothetical protein
VQLALAWRSVAGGASHPDLDYARPEIDGLSVVIDESQGCVGATRSIVLDEHGPSRRPRAKARCRRARVRARNAIAMGRRTAPRATGRRCTRPARDHALAGRRHSGST